MRQALQLDLRAEDLALVAAAIDLGDWLLAYPACTPTQARAIRYLQEHLRRLPLVSPEMLEAEYGFAILIGAGWDAVTPEPWEGLARGWSISLSVTELLVSMIHTANPEIPAHLNEHENFFEFFVGELNPNFMPGYSFDWRAAVQQPLALVTEGAVFRVETETWDEEGHVDIQKSE